MTEKSYVKKKITQLKPCSSSFSYGGDNTSVRYLFCFSCFAPPRFFSFQAVVLMYHLFAILTLGKQTIYFSNEFYHKGPKPSFHTPFSKSEHISSTPWVRDINTRVFLYSKSAEPAQTFLQSSRKTFLQRLPK